MSNVETRPVELRSGAPAGAPTEASRAAIEILTAREVPLGGVRAMRVRRTLPQRARSLIGAWCFADHYGPDDVRDTGGMVVPPHPHTGLQTVSWLFAGELEHRDSLGTRALVRPGELNLMTGGHGICHSEVSTSDTRTLQGVQLWLALPAAHRDAPREFRHFVPPPIDLDTGTARVFLGELAGARSPVPTFTPLLGAELTLEPGARLRLPVDPGFEHGVLVDTGTVTLAGAALARAALGYLGPGAAELTLANPAGEPARVILLGGPPFGEQIVMWWNFVARSHEEIVAFRSDWEAGSDRFGAVVGYAGVPDRLPAPALPNTRLRPRANPPGAGGVTVDDRVVDNPQAQRFELYLGEEKAGVLEYDLDGDRLELLHTEVSPRFEGQGLGGTLARHALDDARTRGRHVLPHCKFVRAWIAKHPDYLDLVPEPDRVRFGL